MRKDDDDLEYLRFGILCYVLLWNGFFWIIFVKSMIIKLKGEFWVNLYKIIDGCGVDVYVVGV